MIDFDKIKEAASSIANHVERAFSIDAWGTTEPFFDKSKAPKFFERSEVEYATLPMSYLKKKGLWHEKLDEILPFLPEGVYIAGGFLRGIMAGEKEITGDIDFFFNSGRAMTTFSDMLINPSTDELKAVFGTYRTANPQWRLDSKPLRLINFFDKEEKRPKLQLVKLIWYTDPCHVIDSFDFTVAQFVTDGKTLYYNPQGIDDIATKSLKLHRSQSPIFTLNRILKYMEKGYSAAPEDFKAVADEAVKLLLTADLKKLEDYFYISAETNKNSAIVIEPIPKAWLGRVWKFLAEGEGSTQIFARIFGGKEEIEQPKVVDDFDF